MGGARDRSPLEALLIQVKGIQGKGWSESWSNPPYLRPGENTGLGLKGLIQTHQLHGE